MAQYEAKALSPHMDSQPGLTFIPTVGPDISWDPGELNIRFEMDKLNFDWRVEPDPAGVRSRRYRNHRETAA